MWPCPPSLAGSFPSFPVYFARACVVPQVEIGRFPSDFYVIEAQGKHHVVRRDPTNDGDLPRKLLELYASCKVTAFTEYRQKLSYLQPDGLADQLGFLCHVFIVLEVDDGEHFICTERYSDALELIIGRGEISRTFMMKFRPTGEERYVDRCQGQPRQEVVGGVKISDLIEWIDFTVSRNWKPYDFVRANCHHWASQLQRYLRDPKTRSNFYMRPVVTPMCSLEPQPLSMKCRQAALQKLANGELTLDHVEAALRGDRDAVLAAVSRNGRALQHADEALRSDREVVRRAVLKDGRMLQYASAELRSDCAIVLSAIQEDSRALAYADSQLWTDRDFVLRVLELDGLYLRFASSELKRDREVALAAVQKDGIALAYADEELKADERLVLVAVSVDGRAFQHASLELRSNPRFVLEAVRNAGRPSVRNAPLPPAIAFGTPTGDNDPPVPEEEEDEWDLIPNREASVLAYASQELRADKELVQAAVRISGWLLEHAAPELRNDRTTVMLAVQSFGRALQFASEELRADREVVMMAVQEDGISLKYVGPTLRNDPHVVMAAVRQDPRAVQFISDEFGVHPEIADVLSPSGAPIELNVSTSSHLAEDTEEICMMAL